MDDVDVKAELKAARESIRTKDFKDVIRRCKLVLKADKDNYNAYVFIGVAAEGLDQPAQAEQAYRKAIQLSPKQATAWQGLQKLCEKSTDPQLRAGLADAYGGLATCFEAEPEKWIEYSVKRAEMLHAGGNVREAVLSLLPLVGADRATPLEERVRIRCKIVDFGDAELSKPQPDADVRRLVEESLEAIVASSGDATRDLSSISAYRARLLRLHIQRMRAREPTAPSLSTMRELCGTLSMLQPTDSLAFEVAVVLSDARAPPARPDRVLASRFAHMHPTNPHAQLALGHALVQLGAATDRALGLLGEAVKRLPHLALAWLWYGECCLARRDDEGAGNAARRGIALLANPSATASSAAAAASAATGLVLGASRAPAVALTTQVDMDPAACGVVGGLDLLLAATYLHEGTRQALAQAKAVYERVLARTPSDSDALLGLARTSMARGEREEASRYLGAIPTGSKASNDAQALRGFIALSDGRVDEAVSCLRAAIASCGDRAEYHLWLAQSYWAKGGECRTDKTLCQAEAMAAARIDPFCADAFSLLGDLFRDVFGDVERAKRCYWKAVRVDPRCDAAGVALSDILQAARDEEGLLDLYRAMTAKNGRSTWAWLRLGLFYQAKGQHADAIERFQSALRIETANARLWEALADSYAASGRLLAATKAFARAHELDPSDYCATRIACLDTTLGMTAKAIASLESILARRPDYVPAAKALADAQLAHARQKLALGMIPRAAECLRKCVEIASTTLAQETQVRALWKTAGDACLALSSCPEEVLAGARVQTTLDSLPFQMSAPDVVALRPPLPLGALGGDQLRRLRVAAACSAANIYAECVALRRGASEHWHDLAVACGAVAEAASECEGMEGVAGHVRAFALECLRTALRLTPGDHRLWLSYGALAAANDDPSLAQHAFIRSMQLYGNNAPAWANLGLLYWSEGRTEDAHAAFSRAQSLDPTHALPWAGQALIAESVGHEDEAADLFRHASELDATMTRANIGFATHASIRLRTPATANSGDPLARFRGLVHATTAAARAVDRAPRNALVHGVAGLLLEAAGRNGEAQAHFAACGTLASDPAVRVAASVNEGRVLNRLNRPADALSVLEKAGGAVSFKAAMAQGRAHFLLGAWEASARSYEAALLLAQSGDGSDRAGERVLDATIGMAQAAYYSGDYGRARQLLLQSAASGFAYPRCLHALCAMAILQGDHDVSMAAIAELLKSSDDALDDAWRVDTALLLSAAFRAQGLTKESGRFLLRLVHMYPQSWRLWHRLSAHLLNSVGATAWYESAGAIALRAALSSLATFRSHPNEDEAEGGGQWVEDPASPHALVSAALLAAGSLPYPAGASSRALVQAKVAVHSDVGNIGAWVALSAAVHAAAALREGGVTFSNAAPAGEPPSDSLGAQGAVCAAYARDAAQRKLISLSPDASESQGTGPVHAAAFNAYAPALARVALWASLAALETHTRLHDPAVLAHIDGAIQEVVATNPAHAANLYVQLGRVLLAYGDGTSERATAPAAFKNALRLDVGNAIAWQELARAYALNGRPNCAEACLRLCVELSATKSARLLPMMRIAHLALCAKKRDLALEAAGVIMQMDRGSPAVVALASIVYTVHGDARSARRSAQAAVEESDRCAVEFRRADIALGRRAFVGVVDVSRQFALLMQVVAVAKAPGGGKGKEERDKEKEDPLSRMDKGTPLYAAAVAVSGRS